MTTPIEMEKCVKSLGHIAVRNTSEWKTNMQMCRKHEKLIKICGNDQMLNEFKTLFRNIFPKRLSSVHGIGHPSSSGYVYVNYTVCFLEMFINIYVNSALRASSGQWISYFLIIFTFLYRHKIGFESKNPLWIEKKASYTSNVLIWELIKGRRCFRHFVTLFFSLSLSALFIQLVHYALRKHS